MSVPTMIAVLVVVGVICWLSGVVERLVVEVVWELDVVWMLKKKRTFETKLNVSFQVARRPTSTCYYTSCKQSGNYRHCEAT